MSLDALRDVMTRSQSTGAARLVLLVIAYHADRKTGDSYCSRRLLAQEANVSTATVHTALGELLGAGEIEILLTGAGRKSTTYRIIPSGSATESLPKAVVAQSARRSGSVGDPVVAQSAGSYIGGTENQGKVEPRASAAPPDGGASRFTNPTVAEDVDKDWRSALGLPTRPVPAHPGPHPGPQHPAVGNGTVSDDGMMRDGTTGNTGPPRKRRRPPRTRRGREPPAVCTPVRKAHPKVERTRLEDRLAREQLMTLETA